MWHARDSVLGRDVAVKVVDVATDDPVAARRFQQEARTAAALSHPHVVGVHDAGTEGGRAFLVMELLAGPSLAELVRHAGPLPPDHAVELAAQAAAGLEAVHRAGAVHRDVKPGNLVLDDHGRVRLVDFGIARLAEATSTQLTASGAVIGSAAYLSPEQARGGPATAASDHYALGCTVMTLVTGEPPFTAEHPVAVLRQHLDEAPPRLRDRRPDVPPWLDDAVDDLLAKDPVRREAGLAALLGRPSATPSASPRPTTTPAAPASATAVLPAGTSASAPVPGTTQVLPAPARRSRTPVVAAVAAVVLVLLVIALLLLRDDDPTGTTADPSTQTTATTRAPEDRGGEGASTDPPTTPSDEVAPADLATAVADLRSTIAGAASSGALDEKAAEQLDRKVEDLQKAVDEAKRDDDVGKALDELVKKLDDAQAKGEVTSSAAESIRAQVEAVRSAQ